ncbi:MAG TPA: hypothetical protein VEG27_13545 [Usitatibacter sp.]|nr:hypothetical protein [Usitatibacter sp.]
MSTQAYDRRPAGTVDLDLCFDCQAIWFDAFESPALAAGGVLALFRTIETQGARQARAIGAVTRCVTCRAQLQLTHDIERSNRFVYYRCPAGHGRFTTFMQFLREKQFVRSLTPPEIERLKATVAQVRCSNCGAPVSIERDAECPYCHSPIAILDADAVRKALEDLDAKAHQAPKVDPEAAINALLEGQRLRGLDRDAAGGFASPGPVDLVHEALSMLFRIA